MSRGTGFRSHWTSGLSCHSPSWLWGACATCRERVGCSSGTPGTWIYLCSAPPFIKKKRCIAGDMTFIKVKKPSTSNLTLILKMAFHTFRATRTCCRKKSQNAHLHRAGVVISAVWNLCWLSKGHSHCKVSTTAAPWMTGGKGLGKFQTPASPSEQGWHRCGSAMALLGDSWKPPRVAIWISANTVLGEDEVLIVEVMYTC